ncbi:MAG: ABC transporter permease [Candidatus Omnitrophica bacterium]|nr:ABC transporter permease [Candidatus Omnitrophota bacterium]
MIRPMLFLKNVAAKRSAVLELAKNDFKNRYLGSYLGILWAFIQPAVYILIIWFVFQVGFKSKPVDNYPFIIWLMAGAVPWFFFAESLANATNAVCENSYLVKKIVFPIGVLPIVKVVSSLFVHIFFVAVLLVIYCAYGYRPGIYLVQVLYYLMAAVALVLGLSFMTSALLVFVKDVRQCIDIILQFGFWVTPIFWSVDILPEHYRFIIKANPVYYVTEGYRNSLIFHKWFWEYPAEGIYFWVFTLVTIVLGASFFIKLKPHFADVL